MTSDQIYEQCLPILQNASLEEEDKTDQLEDLIRKEAHLTGKPLENAVLDTLWRFRNGGTLSTSPPISRHAVVRSARFGDESLSRDRQNGVEKALVEIVSSNRICIEWRIS